MLYFVILIPYSCRPYGIPFYATLIGPFVLVYLFNWVMFVIIIASLIRNTNKRKNKISMANEKKASTTMFKRHLIIAIGLSLFFGLGWGLGLPATNAISNVPARVFLQILFIFFSGFQGVFIFIMQCARSEDARKEWTRWLKKLTCGTVDVGKSGLGHSNANIYKKNSSDSRYSGATLPRTSNTMVAQIGNSETLRRTVLSHQRYSSHSNLLLYGSQSSLVIMEDVKKEAATRHKSEDKNLDLSVVYENVLEEDDSAESAASKQLEDTRVDVWPRKNEFSNPLQFVGEPEDSAGGQYVDTEV